MYNQMHSHSTRPRLIRSLAHVPVTALALHRAPCGRLFALAGIDTAVVVYDAGADADGKAESPADVNLDADAVLDGAVLAGVRSPLCTIPVFASQPIHGIQVRAYGDQCTVLVWGAREVAVFSADGLFKEIHHLGDGVSEEDRPQLPKAVRATAPDWICDGAISPYDAHIAMLATAHNEVVELRFDPSPGRITLSAPVCPARPMLFTARVAWESPDAVLVAGGTVFGHILVWRYRLQGRSEHGAAAVAAAAATESLFDLQGFEGSIFGVDVSPLMTLDDGSAVRVLAGCSDDRTIRVWDITQRAGSSATGSNFDQQDIDTGFGGNFDGADGDDGAGAGAQASGMSPAPLAVVGMGHASRIWGVRFARALCRRPETTLAVYSFGEDAVTQRWLLMLSGKAKAAADADAKPLTGRLSQDQAYALHHGKHLWSHAMLAEDDGLSIATGGADSQISIIRRRSPGVQAEPASGASVSNGSVVLDVGDILRSVAVPTSPAAAKEIIGRYDFLTHDQILVTTNQGRILLGSLRGGGDWEEVSVDRPVAETLRSCYVLRTIADGAALLGTTGGEIFLFQLRTKEVRRVAALPGKIVDMSRLSAKKPGAQDVVRVLVFLHGQADSHLLTIDLSCGSLQSQEQIRGLDPRFAATSAAMINGMIIVGSRHGWLSIMKRDVKGGTYRPILDLATRSFDSITAIVPLPQRKSQGAKGTSPSPYILVTSKDGKYRIYEIEGEGDSLRLALRHETSPPFGPVITDAWFTSGPVPELMLSGFRSKAFVIWNESRKEEVANVDCGGAHRTFQLVYDEQDASRYRFAFTKTSKLSLHSADQPAHRSLKTGVHGREIKTLSSNGRYIASGAEDTTIRIWEHHPEREGTGAEMSCVATMKAHVTGIQRLAWFEGDYLFSSAGNEEFFVWRVRELDSSYRGLAVFCEAEFESKSAEADLRIMDFDVLRHEDGAIIITMVFSNSTLKTFRYTCGDKGRFELVAEGSYTGACLTQIRHLSVQGDVLHILAASTDGHLTVWRAFSERGTYALEQASQLHQNSIKSLDLLDDLEGGYLVLTGGDDNAVGVARVEQRPDQGWQTAGRGVVRRAHAAAVTGVALVRRGRDIFGVSSGNDQSVKAWRIARGQTTSRIGLVGEASTGVADVGDLALLGGSTSPRATFVVAGVGMEIWNLLLE